MPSSTSSSSSGSGSGPRASPGAAHARGVGGPARAAKVRPVIEPAAIALGLAVIGALGLAAGTVASNEDTRALLAASTEHALRPPPGCDVVIVGDSHARQGIIPSVIAEAMGAHTSAAAPTPSVYSFAQPGMPLSPEFLRAAAEGLQPGFSRPHAADADPVRHRCLLIGVSLTTQKAPLRYRRRQFEPPRSWSLGVEEVATHTWPSWLEPFAPTPAAARARVRVSNLHSDGWRERDFEVRRDPSESAAAECWNLMAMPFDRLMASANRAALDTLAREGVRVVVFNLPSDVSVIEPMTEAWAGMSGTDYARAICPENGLVVELTFLPGDTYDGHHLHPDAARRVSEELARTVAEWLTNLPPTPAPPPEPRSSAGVQLR